MEKYLKQENIKLKRITERLQPFYEIFECIISSNQELLFDRILEVCKKETDSFHGFIGILKSNSEMYIPTFKNIMDSCKVESGRLSKDVFLSRDDKHFKYLYEVSLKTMKPYFTNEVDTEKFLSSLPKGHIKISNFLSVPILLRGRSAGVIALSNSTEDYTDISVEKVEKFGKLIGLFLEVSENSNLLEYVNSFLNIFDDVFYFVIEGKKLKFVSNSAVDFILENYSFFTSEGESLDNLPCNELFDFIRYVYLETLGAKKINENISLSLPISATFNVRSFPIVDGDSINGVLISMKDLTEIEDILDASKKELDFQKIISAILQEILKNEDLMNALNESFDLACQYATFDRATVFERGGDGSIVQSVNWAKDSFVADYKIPENNLFWQKIYDMISVNNIILGNIENSGSDISDFFSVSKAKSVFIFPMHIKGALKGFIIFEDMDIKNPSIRELDFLRIFSNIISGVIAQKKAEEDLIYESTHDKLTDLYNRAYYEAEIERIHKSRNFPVAFFIIDLNGLKQVNDNLGHVAGDNLIKSAGKILKNSARGCDCIARIGGDEFAVIVQNASLEIVDTIIKRIIKNQEEFNKTAEIQVSAAIGVSIAHNENEIEKAIKSADANMYENKRKIKNPKK